MSPCLVFGLLLFVCRDCALGNVATGTRGKMGNQGLEGKHKTDKSGQDYACEKVWYLITEGKVVQIPSTTWKYRHDITLMVESGVKPETINQSTSWSEKYFLSIPCSDYMNNHCGKSLEIHGRNAILIIPWEGNHPRSNTSCEVLVESFDYQNYQLGITFHHMDMSFGQKHKGCVAARLDMYDGRNVFARRLTGPGGLCGKSTEKVFDTTLNALTLVFKTRIMHPNQYESFEAVITPFHQGKRCDTSEYKCSNGRCISEDLVCNGYNNCGDDSDEEKCAVVALSIAAIIAIIIGSLIFVGIIITIIVCRCCCSVCGYERL